MGKSYSKTEDKEILITQNAAGSNAGAAVTDQEAHVLTNNILVTTVLVVLLVLLIAVLCLKAKEKQQKWIQKRIDSEFVRRMRLRLSGRREQNNEEV